MLKRRGIRGPVALARRARPSMPVHARIAVEAELHVGSRGLVERADALERRQAVLQVLAQPGMAVTRELAVPVVDLGLERVVLAAEAGRETERRWSRRSIPADACAASGRRVFGLTFVVAVTEHAERQVIRRWWSRRRGGVTLRSDLAGVENP